MLASYAVIKDGSTTEENWGKVYQKCCSLEEKYFVCIDNVSEMLEIILQLLHVGYEEVNDGGPRMVKCLVPYGGTETGTFQGLGQTFQIVFSLSKNLSKEREIQTNL